MFARLQRGQRLLDRTFVPAFRPQPAAIGPDQQLAAQLLRLGMRDHRQQGRGLLLRQRVVQGFQQRPVGRGSFTLRLPALHEYVHDAPAHAQRLHADLFGQIDVYDLGVAAVQHIQPGADHICLAAAAADGAHVLAQGVDDHLRAHLARHRAAHRDDGGQGHVLAGVEQLAEGAVDRFHEGWLGVGGESDAGAADKGRERGPGSAALR